MLAERLLKALSATAVLTVATLSGNANAQVTVPYTQNFDTFTTCSTTCNAACSLPVASQWENAVGGDTMDWTVHSGSTSSSTTGPSADHTSGSGR